MDWKIAAIECYPEHEGRKNAVVTAHWTLTTTEGEYAGRVYGSVGFTLNPDAEFIPYEKLTEEQVVGWVKSTLGDEQVLAYEANLTQQIADQINPPVIKPPLPWAASDPAA